MHPRLIQLLAYAFVASILGACADDAPGLPDDRQYTPSLCCECSCTDGADVCQVLETESEQPGATCEELCETACAADAACGEVESIGICEARQPPPSGANDLVCTRACAIVDDCQVSIEHLAPNGCLEQCRTERVPTYALACIDAAGCDAQTLYGCFAWEAHP